MNLLLRPFQQLGRFTVRFFAYFGELAVLMAETAGLMLTHRPRFRLLVRETAQIGMGSLPIIMITGAFTGAVFAAQMSFAFSDYGLGTTVGAVVSVTVCRELGPVLTSLALAGPGRLGDGGATRHHEGHRPDRCPAVHGS